MMIKKIFSSDKTLVYYLNTGKLPEPDLFGEVPELPEKVKDARQIKDKGQRLACGCMVSKDIGMYDTCRHFCVYCYANTSKEQVLKILRLKIKNISNESHEFQGGREGPAHGTEP